MALDSKLPQETRNQKCLSSLANTGRFPSFFCSLLTRKAHLNAGLSQAELASPRRPAEKQNRAACRQQYFQRPEWMAQSRYMGLWGEGW